ncbi:hypothetical protein [Photobacterium aquimaris]|uniref:Uncharacterized protein n=1 Tax=Photobacterium aquimaris TaxID=512643 RepID=A0A1Y6L1G2_9GAMM|nr:hypothetical protein [Photobacterium aquimaris]SMY16478.1 hypothetical protein PAQU9191_01709 [Photobacterium aquimaris]
MTIIITKIAKRSPNIVTFINTGTHSINEVIDVDCSRDEILETIFSISFSCGFARSIDAIFETKLVQDIHHY